MFNNFFFFKNRSFCEITWKNCVQPDRPQITICACALHAGYLGTHTEYVIIIDIPLKQWSHEHATMLRYDVYVYCLSWTLAGPCIIIQFK